ncbi:tRNA (N6-threonylcarbamoyladenosine(37)-N6)-methyltransferase TrmO [Candidatus Bathyarchaeota archaeon]|nr:tRNA (N6-threonylcarbamoyladenosine(37)-N6)-methyltransferase TrmO [Candidatus Bathyarchaeota archaeon]NIU81320.1 tRNA (N6-threonylcarbamoyladenosine(37)-N6)-methyltransferase TrmO [Candidatus Bathyarchaeota archaeon]NIV67962.1 tRNA (N6-threonylcarbamoyladenosine(37)-N6)-methyltransferase TrmO [Candidatus Bathyarchaeota archaeon]NIW16408.1 tRNA (N6-threonylcarbamoyladenosine(37)-N6)-methyltransferase TrmO [Candidatus Bathyarchaeota archaeon]NIW35006.1 tRNA (N6-threonylcarbamoyladenosine(37)-
MELEPIGIVRTEAFGKEVRARGHSSEVVLSKDLTGALDGLDDFSHIFVIFWMHKIYEPKRRTIKVNPRGRRDLPLVGIFATRTPYHPNPIGLTLVELLGVEDNVLTVLGLDAFDGTPVLDIKPFDHWDMVDNVQVPDWWKRLEKERSERGQTSLSGPAGRSKKQGTVEN